MAGIDLNCLPSSDVLLDLNESPVSPTDEGEDEDNQNSDVLFDLKAPICLIDQGNEVDNQAAEHEIDSQSDIEIVHGNVSQSELHPRKKRVLTNEERCAIYKILLARSMNGKLKRKTTKEVASMFSVSLKSVQRLWKRVKDTPSGSIVDVKDRIAGNSGRKRLAIDRDCITSVPLKKRQTLRSLAQALQCSHVTLYKRKREGLIRRHSNPLKPLLRTEQNKIARLKFCISMLDPSSLPHEPKFSGMYNVIHIDEKWFYMTKKSVTYYLHRDEADPVHSCQSKNFIGKVMFLAAIARPRFDEEGNVVFYGKIGVFPFVTKELARRRSRNREAGTLVTRPITSVKKETIQAFLLQKVIPSIHAKWPAKELGETIYIQQENARTHIRPEDEEFQMVASQNGFDIRLLCQPANSPDMNVLDLGFFNAIQSLQYKECPRNVDELIQAVEKAFEEYPVERINHVFLTLQLCMKECMSHGGSNDYVILHIDKIRLERSGCLPKQIECESALVENVINIVEEGMNR